MSYLQNTVNFSLFNEANFHNVLSSTKWHTDADDKMQWLIKQAAQWKQTKFNWLDKIFLHTRVAEIICSNTDHTK